jgi:hypothetical protein
MNYVVCLYVCPDVLVCVVGWMCVEYDCMCCWLNGCCLLTLAACRARATRGYPLPARARVWTQIWFFNGRIFSSRARVWVSCTQRVRARCHLDTRLSRLGKDRACSTTAPHPHTYTSLDRAASICMRFLPACKLQSYGLYVDWHVLRSCCCVSLLHVRTGVVCLQGARARARPTVMFVGRCGWLPISTVRSRGRTDNPRGLPRTLVASCAQATYVEVELYAYTYTPSLFFCNDTFLEAKTNIVRGPR